MPSPATSLRPNKWLDGVDPDAPVHHAAVAAVARRWSAVAGYLPLAALHGNDDVEYVHQLRVSTRRADAALE